MCFCWSFYKIIKIKKPDNFVWPSTWLHQFFNVTTSFLLLLLLSRTCILMILSGENLVCAFLVFLGRFSPYAFHFNTLQYSVIRSVQFTAFLSLLLISPYILFATKFNSVTFSRIILKYADNFGGSR